MRTVLKILGKSALCFISLTAAGWAVGKLSQFLLRLNNSLLYILLHSTVIVFILWFLLGVWYAYTLFLLFNEEKNRCLIMALNGAGAAILFYISGILLWNIQAGAYVNLLFTLSDIGVSTILLAFIFRHLVSAEPKHVGDPAAKEGFKNAVGIIARSALCFIGLSAVLYGYSFLPDIAKLERFIVLVISLSAISYAFTLYRLLKKNKRRLLAMLINAVFLMAVWGFMMLPFMLNSIFRYIPPVFVIGYGSTALFTMALAFIFGSVERRGNRDDYISNGPSMRSPA